jgi:hypothetical protein
MRLIAIATVLSGAAVELAALTVSAGVLLAQVSRTSTGLEPGARIRLSLSQPDRTRRIATLIAEDSSVFVVSSSRVDTIPIASVIRLERSVPGSRTEGAVLWSLAGVGLGAVSAGVWGHYATIQCDCDDPGYGALAAIPGGLVGGVVGAFLGHRFGERWWPVRLPNARP